LHRARKHIRLGSAVRCSAPTIPFGYTKRFATLDAAVRRACRDHSGPRVVHGVVFRSSGIASTTMTSLFEEKLQLFAELLKDGPVTWSGTTRPPLTGQRAYPTTESGSLRAWVGVGGSPESVVRAARYGFPLVPLRSSAARLEDSRHTSSSTTTRSPSSAIPIARLPFTRPDTSRSRTSRAREELWPHYSAFHARIGRERGWPPMTRAQFDASTGPRAPSSFGAPETVAAKIVDTVKALGARAIRYEVQQRHAAAFENDAQHRALRNEGDAPG